MNLYDIIDLEIVDLCFGGDGIGRSADGMAVFVPFSAVGDKLRVKVVSLHKRYARAVIEEIVVAGEGRVEASCPYYGKCGGCVYQHLSYDMQMQVKREQLMDALGKIGGLKDLPVVEPCVKSPKERFYRNKIAVQPFGEREETPLGPVLQYGFYELDNRTVFQLDRCELVDDCLNEMVIKIPKTKWGHDNAKREHPRKLTCRLTSNGETLYYFGRAPENIPWLHERVLDGEVSVPMGSFWQVNSEVAEMLLSTVAAWFKESPTRIVIDAYAGVGPFSLAFSDSVERRIIIEVDKHAVSAAKYNHGQWKYENCEFVSESTEKGLPKVLVKLGGRNRRATVVLNPPRTGCDKRVVNSLLKSAVKQILYVSCNASTLARDLKLFCQNGDYRVQKIAMFDMFPQTAHFETAVLLRRN